MRPARRLPLIRRFVCIETIGFESFESGETWIVRYEQGTCEKAVINAMWQHLERPGSKLTLGGLMAMIQAYRKGRLTSD